MCFRSLFWLSLFFIFNVGQIVTQIFLADCIKLRVLTDRWQFVTLFSNFDILLHQLAAQIPSEYVVYNMAFVRIHNFL